MPAGVRSSERRAARAVERDRLGGDRRRRAALAAVGAFVDAEVPEVDGLVDVGGATVPAVLGIRCVLHLGERHGRVLDAEIARTRYKAAEVGDQRVVGVQNHSRACRKAPHRRRPAVGDRVELAVAVELVAEQVPQQDRARA